MDISQCGFTFSKHLLRCLPSKWWWLHCGMVTCLLAQHFWLWLDTFLEPGLPFHCDPCLPGQTAVSKGTTGRQNSILTGYGSPTLTQATSYQSLTAILLSSSAFLPPPPKNRSIVSSSLPKLYCQLVLPFSLLSQIWHQLSHPKGSVFESHKKSQNSNELQLTS